MTIKNLVGKINISLEGLTSEVTAAEDRIVELKYELLHTKEDKKEP